MSRFNCLLAVFALCAGCFAQVPRSHHVVVLTLENHTYEQVIGNPDMPFYNQLAKTYGLATQYYSTEHNSITGLMWLVAGTWVTHDDSTPNTFDTDNIVRAMKNSGGRTWRVYASNLPSIGFTGYADNTPYLKRHNPLAYFTDVANDPAQAQNLLPLDPYFQQDIANGTLPEYSYVVPDADEDAHDGTLAQADQWMQANVPQLLASPQFQRDGILLIVWDEGTLDPIGNYQYNDSRGEGLDPAELVYNPNDPDTIWAIPGGRTATLVIGPGVKPAFQSQSFYNAQNLLRTTCDALALSTCPGAAATAVPMTDFFVGQPDTPPRQPLEVVISSPATTTISSPNGTPASVRVVADAVDRVSRRVNGMLAYMDDQQIAGGTGVSHVDTTLSLSPGTHHLVIIGWSELTSVVTGQPDVEVSYKSERMLTVGAGSAPTVVNGRVTDISSGSGIAGATVTVDGQTATADASGAFTFNSITPGNYQLSAAANGYFSESAAVAAVSGTTASVNVQLPTGGIVAGTVTANGAPAANATVAISGGSVATTKTVTTDSTGAFSSNWVPVGNYTVSVSMTGYPAQTSTVVAKTGATASVNLALTSKTTVSGQVVDISSGRGISGATVTLGSLTAVSDSSGAFNFSVVPGSYSVSAVAPGYFQEASTFTATLGAAANVKVQLPTGGLISGTASANGSPLANATITISGGSVATTRAVQTGSSGSFYSDYVPVGSYTVSLNATGYPAQSLNTTVNTGSTATANFTLSSTATVNGQVTDISTGMPIAGATITIGSQQMTADSNGNYSATLPSGSVSASAVANGYFKSTRTVSLTPGPQTANFQLATGGKLAGTITQAGIAVANATVVISGGVINSSVTTTTNSAGAYNSDWVPVGPYTVSVSGGTSSKSAAATVLTGNTTTLNVTLP